MEQLCEAHMTGDNPMREADERAVEHTEERMQRCAKAMRDAFFREFGHPDTLTEAERSECVRTLMALHCGEFVEAIARFKSPAMPLRDACVVCLDLMMES